MAQIGGGAVRCRPTRLLLSDLFLAAMSGVRKSTAGVGQKGQEQPSRKGLAAQLLELANPTPQGSVIYCISPDLRSNGPNGTCTDVDPENSLAALDGLLLDPQDDQAESRLGGTEDRNLEERRPMRGEPAMGVLYRGKPVARSSLFDAGSDHVSGETESGDLDSASSEGGAGVSAGTSWLLGAAGIDSDAADDDSNDDAAAEDEDSQSESETETTTAHALQGLQPSTRTDQERAVAAKVQRNMWDSFVDLRIQLQPLLDASSRLPSPQMWNLITEASSAQSGASASAKSLIVDLMQLQEELFENNDQVHAQVRSKKRKFEKISSVEESSHDADFLWEEISETKASCDSWTGRVLDEWSAKSLFASGINASKLKTLNQSLTKQIDEILVSQRSRILGRAQTRRVGTDALFTLGAIAVDAADPELYDDSDFYQAILKELVESGVQATSDPVQLTRQFLKLRNAAGKKKHRPGVDRRASKGRKLKFSEHPKLLSFMAPEPHRHSSQDSAAAEQLSMSLFGKRSLLTL